MRFIPLLSLLPLVLTHHTTHDFSDAAVARREEFQTNARRSLRQCTNHFQKRDGVAQRAVARRQDFLAQARRDKGIVKSKRAFKASNGKRDFEDVLNKNHKTNQTGITPDSDPCKFITPNYVLGPEVTEGPYYVDGELIQSDLRAGQESIDLYVDFQLIDVETCEPVSNIYVDFWHTNATGVYSAIAARGNGNGDTSNLQVNHGRGIQLSDKDGVVQFLTMFPGHYTGRTTHIHVMANSNGTVFSNGTFKAETVKHVGQIFFDQSLIADVETYPPYNTNTQPLTTNAQDGIMAGESASIDPVVEYTYLGDDASAGIFAWVSFGINTTVAHNVSKAATWTEDGAVPNPNSGPPGGPGGPPPPPPSNTTTTTISSVEPTSSGV
ncbi:aromatic compound dioxygenase [Flagelloscypha sp. PMI_526]|nr:aromatic compound dioxygenase [Flagelloscypha sp. PMI_526]